MNPEWIEEAHRRFGDREDVFEYADTPYSLWANLRDVFKRAYDYPYKEADIRSIYEFAEWCCQQPQEETAKDDLLTCVAVCFYEHIPEVEAAVKDLPRWFKLSDIMTMREIFCYQVGEAGFERMVEAYPKSQRAKIAKKKPTSSALK
jgi:hypothetical protein